MKNKLSGSTAIDMQGLYKAIQNAVLATQGLTDANEKLIKSQTTLTETSSKQKRTQSQLKTLINELSKSTVDISNSIKSMNTQLSNLSSRLQVVENKVKSGAVKTAKTEFKDLNSALKSVNVSTSDFENKFNQVGTSVTNGTKVTTTYVDANNRQLKVIKDLNGETATYSVTLNTLNTNLNKNVKSMSNMNSQSMSYAEVQKKLGVNLEASFTKMSSSVDANGNILEKWTNNAGKVVTISGTMVDGNMKYTGSLKEVNEAVDTNAKQADKWKYSWSKAFQSFTTYMTVTQVFYTVKNGIKDMIYQVADLDSALVELRKVTTLESDELKRFTDEAFAAADAVAKTGTEMIQAATEFARAGYAENQIIELGKVASMYTNIADEEVSASEAAEFMIAQMKAFNIEAEDSIHIIDAVNEVANNFAVSSADIANNLGNSSAVMASAGNSYEQMIGLLTAGTEITRSASKVSNGLKTITLRLQGMNDEGEADLELMAKMETMFNKLNLSVYNTDGSLKNTYEILRDLAPVYEDATAAEKAYITETIAGKYQAQNAAAILSNFETALKATETALNSNGSAARENEIAIESIKGKIKDLNAQFQEFARNVISSGLIKVILELGQLLLWVANSGVGQLAVKATMILVGLAALQQSFKFLSKTVAVASNAMLKYKLNQDGLHVSNLKVIASTQTLAKSYAVTGTSLNGVAKGLNLVNANAKAVPITFNTITASIKAMGAALLKSPLFWVSVGFTVVPWLIDKVKELHKTTEELYESSSEEYDSIQSKLEDVNSQLEETSNKIKEINSKDKLTYTDEAELEKLKEVTKELLLQKQLLDEQEEKEKKKLQDLADKRADEEVNKRFTIEQEQVLVKDTGFENKLKDAVGRFDKDFNLDFNYQTDSLSDYIKLLEELRIKYKDNAVAVSLLDEELRRVLEDSDATEQKTQKVEYFGLDTALENNTKKYKEYQSLLDENQKKMADYQKQIEEYEKNNPFIKSDTFDPKRLTGQAKLDYINYEAQKKALEDLNKLNEIYKNGLGNSKENLEDVAKGYENILANTEFSKNLSPDKIKEINSILREIYQYTDPSKVKTIDLNNLLGSGDFSKVVNDLYAYKDAGEVTAEQIDKLREKNVDFDKALEGIGVTSQDVADYMNNMSEGTSESLKNLNNVTEETFETLHNATVTLVNSLNDVNEALLEQAENGQISISTALNLIANGYAAALAFDAETGAITINKEAIIAMTKAKIVAQQIDLTDKIDLTVDALNAESQAAAINTDAWIENIRAKQAAGQELTTNEQQLLNLYAEKKALDGVLDSMNKLGTSSWSMKISNSYKSGSSGSSKEWWEIELEKLKDQFNYNEITIQEYINGLSNLLGKVSKGTEAWRKINDELQKQRLDKVEDDYKRGTISLDEYIKKLKELIKAYKKGTDAWNDLADSIKEALQDKADQQKDDLETAEEAALEIIDREIDKLNELKKEKEDYYDQLIKDKEEANEESEKELELARLQEALENARKEKTKRVWREGLGKKSAKYKGNYIGQMLGIVQTEVRLCLGGALWV